MLSKKKQCHLLCLMIWKVKGEILKVSQCQLFLVDFCGFSSIWRQNLVLYKEVVFLILEFSFATKESLNLSLKFLLGHST